MNPVLKTFLIIAAVLIPVGLGVWQCSEKVHWKGQADSLGTASRSWQGLYLRYFKISIDQERQLLQAKSTQGLLKQERDSAYTLSNKNADKLTYTQKFVGLYNNLVNRGLLDPRYLTDTVTKVVSTTVLVDASYKATEQLKRADSLAARLERGIAVRDAELTQTRTERDAANRSSVYAEGVLTREARTKRPLGFGRKRAALEAAERVRQKRVAETGEPAADPPTVDQPSELEIISNQKRKP